MGDGDKRLVRLGVVAFGCLMLANCSSGPRVATFGNSSNPRLVEVGQPAPKGGGRYAVGKPYSVNGRTYYPAENTHYRAEGLASWYGEDFHGRRTANGEIYDMESISAAHATLPMPSYVRVTNLQNGRSMIVRVNDRGPYHPNRIIDLSSRAAEVLGLHQQGTTRVRVEFVGTAPLEGSDDRQLMATLRKGEPAPTPNGPRFASRGLLADLPLFRKEQATRSAPASREEITEEETASEPPPVLSAPPAPPARTLAARPVAAEVSASPLLPPAPAAQPPVTAYAPLRADGTQALATGRGLY